MDDAQLETLPERSAAIDWRRQAAGLALDLVKGVGWFVVVIGTALAWLGLDVFGGLGAQLVPQDLVAALPDIAVTAAIALALTFAMALVWRGEGRDTWLFVLGLMLVCLLLAGTALVVAFAADGTTGGGPATPRVSVVGAALPLVCTLLGLLVAAGLLFPKRGRVAAGLLACSVEAGLFVVWVLSAVLFA